MSPAFWRVRTRRRESGQVMLLTSLALGLFAIGAMAFAVDMSFLWFTRQSAQAAADAACTAGAMDLLVDFTNSTANQGNFSITVTPPATSPAAINCFSTTPNNTTTNPAPCYYAALNGFRSTVDRNSASLGDNVTVDFPAAGSTAAPPGVSPPPAAIAASPYLRVTVQDNVPTFFAGLLKGLSKQSVKAVAVCGVVEAQAPIPILVLHPTMSGSLSSNGSKATIAIVGGPDQSIQVNSNSSTAVSAGGTIDLHLGGQNETGSDLGTFGGPSSPTGTFLPGTTGKWVDPSAPIADPFAQIPAPSLPAGAAQPQQGTAVTGGTNGCPETAPATCQEFAPGNYSSGIQVKNNTAIFDPGIYYVTGGMSFDSNSCVRPSTLTGDGSGGTVFYFADGNSLSIAANTGKGTHSCPTTAFSTANAACPSNPATLPTNLPTTITGSVLLAPCTGQYGDPIVYAARTAALPLGNPSADTSGDQRGILFFQNRSITLTNKNQPSYSGGGQFLMAGDMYFHQCVLPPKTDTGQGCVSGAFNTQLGLQGVSGATTYILGDIVTDQLSLGGNPNITMDLSPNATFNVLKASLLQ